MGSLTVVGAWVAANSGTIAAVGAAAGAGVSAYSSHEAGVAAANDAKAKSRQAGLEAGQKQIAIRQNMLRALASQNVAAGASGIGTGGSFGANVDRQIGQNKNDLLALNADTSSEQQAYGLQASNAVTTGNLKAGASLLDAGASAVKSSG